MMTPYYEQDGITIYHGDCMEVMSMYAANGVIFDLLLTDPPYGINVMATTYDNKTTKRGASLAHKSNFAQSPWDATTQPMALSLARSLAREQIVFGGNYYELPPSSCWLVWDKENGTNAFADCELAWTNLKKAVRKLTYRWSGMLQQPGRPKEKRVHPTQKPEAVMVWALQHAGEVRTVLDPFMGSGTTLVAAKRLGRKAIGIELEEKYCEIAAKRLAQGALPMEFSA
jgi:DNA modification methylase